MSKLVRCSECHRSAFGPVVAEHGWAVWFSDGDVGYLCRLCCMDSGFIDDEPLSFADLQRLRDGRGLAA